jgi:signal transduction histidine kinase
LSTRAKVWLGSVMGVVAIFSVAAFVLRQSYLLNVICDVSDCLLLASGAAAFVPLALRARGRMRLFWSLITLGLSMWFSYQLLWAYYEVVLRTDVPDLFAGDMMLFLDIVPLMAALALRPHAPEDEYTARLGNLDFALLLVWWLYLYALIVLPWQYVVVNADAYNHDLDTIYLIEKVAFLVGLAACAIASKGQWRKFYAHLFGMMFTYVASSTVANWAISGTYKWMDRYYSGSLYDVPLAVAIGWLTWIGLRIKAEAPEAGAHEVSTVYGVWVARCSMIAVFSLPLFGVWATVDGAVPARIRLFRLALTLLAALVMAVMVFVRQRLLDRELIRLLNRSRNSVDNLKQLQAQILHSERMASIGQLVGGAAHELNNPITAMLGYSDLLLSTKLNAEQQPVAAKIGQYVRRTKSLVASLISFSRQTPAPKTPIDLNTLARTAVKLTQPQWEPQGIEIRTQFDRELQKVMGDSNQLLQVCLQLVANCLHISEARGGRTLTVGTTRKADRSVLEISTDSATFRLPSDMGEVFPQDIADTLGLSACQGILQEHQGVISRERREDGALLLRVELPAIKPSPANARESTIPVLRQSQPFA